MEGGLGQEEGVGWKGKGEGCKKDGVGGKKCGMEKGRHGMEGVCVMEKEGCVWELTWYFAYHQNIYGYQKQVELAC